ncbi:SDR family oxidoreductase [Streptomyces sp. NBC_00344]|uniref:SDR family oxidoreductase n=1 Tax=Streptomyces sp. NBC_00344 TaxID=2975720 RepID=UPI002E1FB33A
MKIAIVGGTGTLGRPVAEELSSRGHGVRVLSRRSQEYRVDLVTGEGLEAGLKGCDVVVDATNSASASARKSARTLVGGSRRLLAAEEAAGVGHHVCVSIVGCDRMPMGYYRVKTEQERVVEQGRVPWTIVRATQFHGFVASGFAAAARWGVIPVPKGRLQTVAVEEVARAVAGVAERPPRRDRVEVAGPVIGEVGDLARAWRTSAGKRPLLLPVPLPGGFGRAFRSGAATSAHPDVRGTVSFEDWLKG